MCVHGTNWRFDSNQYPQLHSFYMLEKHELLLWPCMQMRVLQAVSSSLRSWVLNCIKLHQNLCKHPPVHDHVHVGNKLQQQNPSYRHINSHLGDVLRNATGCLLRPYCSIRCLNMQDLCIIPILAGYNYTLGTIRGVFKHLRMLECSIGASVNILWYVTYMKLLHQS